MQSKGLKELREVALTYSRVKHPNFPEAARCTRNYSDKTSNGLSRAIIDFLNFSGHQAERINCMGRPQDNRKVVTDTLGDMRRIGTVKWLPTSGQKGTADISAVIYGRAVKIEVKIRDKQSEDQKSYQLKIEAAGGYYWLVRSFDEFLIFYNSLL